MLETAKVMPAWLGATSAWLLRWPEELQELMPIEKVMKLCGEDEAECSGGLLDVCDRSGDLIGVWNSDSKLGHAIG